MLSRKLKTKIAPTKNEVVISEHLAEIFLGSFGVYRPDREDDASFLRWEKKMKHMANNILECKQK